MRQEYKDILLRHRAFILDAVNLTSEVGDALVNDALLSPSTLEEWTTYEPSKDRVELLLDHLTESEDPEAFSKFCHVLQECGFYSVSHTLFRDRNNIEWDFISKIGSATSPDNFVDMINDSLIRPMLVEEDRHIIRVLSRAIRSRLSTLSLYLKAEKGRRSHFRQAIAKLAASGADKLIQAAPPCIDMAANDGAFDGLIGREQKLDNVLVAGVRSSIEQSKSTQSALVNQCSLNNGALERFLHKDTRWRYKQSCHSLQIDTLMGMIIEQDNKIIKLNDEYTKVKGHISLSKRQYQHINDTIHWGRVRKPDGASSSPDVTCGATLTAFLDEYMAEVTCRTERFRQRLVNMSEHITELERERTVSLAYLEVGDAGDSLQATVKRNMDKVAHERLMDQARLRDQARNAKKMARENSDLRRQIVELRKELDSYQAGGRDDPKQQPMSRPWSVVMRPLSARRTTEARRNQFRFGTCAR